MYSVRVDKDSISEAGDRLTTFIICFPRVVLAETVTHRMNSDYWSDEDYSFCERTTTKDISKNSASSRAIPFERMLKKIQEDPFMPLWTLNQKGMQGEFLSDEDVKYRADGLWLDARHHCMRITKELSELGIHKQDCNRLLEPWMWVTQLITSSRWDNFFGLRCHQAAHPAFRHVARMMFLARKKSIPRELHFGQWHLPFVSEEEQNKFEWKPDFVDGNGEEIPDLIKFSAARAGWVSYENHDKEGTSEAMLRTYNRFFESPPIHSSPLEHQATPVTFPLGIYTSNLTGWLQARKLIKYEAITKYDPSEEEIQSWGIDGSSL